MTPAPTPIEQRTDWAIHRAAAQAVRSRGGHFFCSQTIGFLATAKPGEELPAELGRPCEQCLRIWYATKKQQHERAA